METNQTLSFTKMEGAGNDYIYFNCFDQQIEDPAALSVALSDRHFGVGGDGVVLICPPERPDQADARMRMFNADGSEAEMCGNGIRCVGKFVYDKGLTDKTEVSVETLAGIKILKLHVDGGKVHSVTVDMGEPVFIPERIPALSASPEIRLSEPETVNGTTYGITAVSMGNPHAVVFVDEITDRQVLVDGPVLEVSPIFPKKANIEFAEVLDRSHIRMRVWERGSGETLACGTGACATAVAAVLNNLADREVTLHLLGGDLHIRWDKATNHVMMTGPAAFVCDGVFYRP